MNRIRGLKKRIEAIIMAIPKEAAAYEFYQELAESTDDPDSKDMFTFLANQEAMHRDKLEEMLQKMQEQLADELNL